MSRRRKGGKLRKKLSSFGVVVLILFSVSNTRRIQRKKNIDRKFDAKMKVLPASQKEMYEHEHEIDLLELSNFCK